MILKRRTNQVALGIAFSFLTASVLAQTENAASAIASNITAKPDALLQIDMNRTSVVDRVIANWGKQVPEAQREALKEKLMGLRSDQLLSATLAGTFDGVLEVINAKEVAQQLQARAIGADVAKTLGSTANDFVYTPITPCRLVDTRGVFSPIYSGGAYAASAARNYQPGGNCGVPAAATAVALQVTTITPPASGDIEIVPGGTTLGNTATMVFSAGQYNSVSTVVKLSGNIFTTQMRGQGGHVAMDMVGYFAPPEITQPACEYWFGFQDFATGSGYNSLESPSCSAGYTAQSRSCYMGSGGNVANNYLQTSGPFDATVTNQRCEWFVGGAGFRGRASITCCRIPGR